VWEGAGAQGALGNSTTGCKSPTEPQREPSHPQAQAQPAGSEMAGGSPLSPSPEEAALWRGSQDRWLPAGLMDTAPHRKQHGAPGTRTDLGVRCRDVHTQPELQCLRLERNQRPLQWGPGLLQIPAKPLDNHAFPWVPPRSAPVSFCLSAAAKS